MSQPLKMIKNPSFTEAVNAQLQSDSPTKRNAIRPSIEQNTMSSPDTATSSKKSSLEVSGGSVKAFHKKEHRIASNTIVPIDCDNEAIHLKSKSAYENEESMKTTARPMSSCSTASESGAKGSISILKKSRYAANSERTTSNRRRDAAGVPIKKGGKRHKIVFKKEIEEVKIIENWKIYNGHDYVHQSCYCNTF